MLDITLCQFHLFPVRETCLRYITKPDGRYQSYLMASDVCIVGESGFRCGLYWPVRRDA